MAYYTLDRLMPSEEDKVRELAQKPFSPLERFGHSWRVR